MSDATPADEALSGLGELAACDLRLARRFCARIEACPDDAAGDERANGLARSYQRMARSYRQSVALQQRFRREIDADARAGAEDAARAHERRVHDLRWAIKARIRPLIWTEREDDRAEDLDALFDAVLDDIAERPDFLDHTPAQHAAAILPALNLRPDEGEAATATADPRPLTDGRLASPLDAPPWADSS